MKYLFVVNPVSGKRDAEQKLVPQIREYLRTREADCEIVLTQEPGHATELVRQRAAEGQPLRVMACGGDGTLNEVVAGAVGLEHVAVGIYACGGGNDYIKCLGYDEGAFMDVGLLFEGGERKVDLLKVNDRFCVNIVSVGIDADVAAAVDKYRRIKWLRGPAAYNLGLLECLLKPSGKQLDITADGRADSGKYIIVVAANGRVYGGGYWAAPEAIADDALIDLVVVDNMSLIRMSRIIPTYKKGLHMVDGAVIPQLSDCVHFERVTSLSLSADTPLTINLDGEIMHAQSVDISMMPQALRLIVPRG